MKGRRPLSSKILVALLIAVAVFFPDFPPASAASTTSASKKPKVSGSAQPPPLSAAGAAALFPSSVVFPIYGDVYPHGLYYAAIAIGDPPKPYFLDVDTGSDLTWLQCDAPCVSCSKGPHPWYRPRKEKLVPCGDPVCAAIHSADAHDQNCDQCDYEVHYADQGSSLGVLVADAFAFRLTNSSVARPSLAFGCGYDQQFSSSNTAAPTDGVLGLGSGKASVLSQLSDRGVTKNVMAHCLSGKGGGYLLFGDDLVPGARMTWAPMSRAGFKNYYSPGPASLYFGTQSLGVNQMDVVLDTGSSYTYFGFHPYQAFLSAVKHDLSKKPLKEEFDDPSLPVCWRGPKPFKTVNDVKKYFKPLTLNFVNGKRAYLEVPPENYVIVTKHGNACLGILNGTEVGLRDLNVIGDISLQDLMVAYDNEKQQIGWVHAACDRLPNVDDVDGGLHERYSLPASMGILADDRPYNSGHRRI